MGIGTNQSNNNGGANSKCVPRSSSTTQSSSWTKKPTYKKVGKNSIQKIKFYSKSCEDSSKQERVFHKLDPKNPQHAHKIQQRRKAIAKGKNTVGYDRYCRSVPKNKRQKRSMITPSTPDHTLDIPNKKWNGMVRSWRIALHKYDPVDLQQSFAAAQEAALAEQQKDAQATAACAEDMFLTAKEKEVRDSGLLNLVQITPDSKDSKQNSTISSTTGCIENGIVSELNRWEAMHQENDDATSISGGEDDDSDDDLL